jgi:benzoylformate decarboxylase
VTMQANLTHRDAIRVPQPLVKWSHEPPRAEEVPLALARGIHLASLPPRGPVLVSIPMDDWAVEAEPAAAQHAIGRSVTGVAAPDPEAVAAVAERLRGASNPVLVAGPDIDAAGAWDAAVGLAERQRLPVWASPATGGGRVGFPENHPQFVGILPPAIGPVSETLTGYDLILVVGSSVFPYYPYIPGELLPAGAELIAVTSDPDEAARAPMGDAIVADVRLTLEALVAAAGDSDRALPEPRPKPETPAESDPISPSAALATLAEAFPDDGIVILEAPSATLAARNHLRISRPGSYFFGAGGGLGFGLAAAVGVQLAQPSRPVVCVVGEGSAQYAITALWSAVAYSVPVTFLVLRNSEYAILKWFAEIEQVSGAPGLDLPGLDTAAIARAYGLAARHATDADALGEGLSEAIAADRPQLVEIDVAQGMALA